MSLLERLLAQIDATGPLSVAQYMTACLHDPDFGYYATHPALGETGDFITAPMISQMFGEMLGVWAASAWELMGQPAELRMVEIGPGDGTLMSDVLKTVRHAPGFLEAADVWLVETSAPLHLVGHSFGGLVGRAAVLAEPALFTSLTLLGSGPSKLVGQRAVLLEYMRPLLAEGGVPAVHEAMQQLAMTDPKAQAVPAPTRAFLTQRFLANSAAGLLGMADAMTTEPDRVAELAATGLPVLVAHGIADDAWTPEAQTDMAQRLGARHEVIPGSIHSPAIENPTRTLEVLLDFWGSVSANDSSVAS